MRTLYTVAVLPYCSRYSHLYRHFIIGLASIISRNTPVLMRFRGKLFLSWPQTNLYYSIFRAQVTQHNSRLHTHHTTVNKWKEFHSHLKSLINSLPPYPLTPPHTYKPKVDTLLDRITPILKELAFDIESTRVMSTSENTETNRLLKLATFLLHRHRRALDQKNMYPGGRLSEIPEDKVKPFTTYARKLDQTLSLCGYGYHPEGAGIRILSIDGGGSRGLVALELMSALEQSTGKRLKDVFDLVYGTSTGALIIFLHFVCNIQIPDCIKIYRKFSQHVFCQSRFGAAKQFWSTHSIYNVELFRESLLEEKSIELPMWVIPSSGSQPRLGVVATLLSGTPQPYLFRNFRMPALSKYVGTCDVTWMEAILASSAAPGYFPEYRIKSNSFQDGGLAANNPSALALHEARLIWPQYPIQCLVSIGTGRMDNFKSLVGSGQLQEEVDPHPSMLSIRDKLRVLLYCVTSSSNGTHDTLSDLLPLLGVPYFRLNPCLPKEVPLDESREEELNLVVHEAKKYISHNKLKFAQLREVLLRKPKLLHNFFRQIKLSK